MKKLFCFCPILLAFLSNNAVSTVIENIENNKASIISKDEAVHLLTFEEAAKIWKNGYDKNIKQSQQYAAEFVKYTNAISLDEKNKCYSLSNEVIKTFKKNKKLEENNTGSKKRAVQELPDPTMNVYLIFNHDKNSKFGIIEDVVPEKDTLSSRCMVKSYKGLGVKIPPYLPYILKMKFIKRVALQE